jgi:hypothetical protein
VALGVLFVLPVKAEAGGFGLLKHVRVLKPLRCSKTVCPPAPVCPPTPVCPPAPICPPAAMEVPPPGEEPGILPCWKAFATGMTDGGPLGRVEVWDSGCCPSMADAIDCVYLTAPPNTTVYTVVLYQCDNCTDDPCHCEAPETGTPKTVPAPKPGVWAGRGIVLLPNQREIKKEFKSNDLKAVAKYFEKWNVKMITIVRDSF